MRECLHLSSRSPPIALQEAVSSCSESRASAMAHWITVQRRVRGRSWGGFCSDCVKLQLRDVEFNTPGGQRADSGSGQASNGNHESLTPHCHAT